MKGDAERLIKRGAYLYTEVGEDFIDEDDEDDETKKYNTFVVTNILKKGSLVVMQEVLENGESGGCTMTSKELGVPEIILGIKLYNELNPPSALGGGSKAPAPKKPARAEAPPKPSEGRPAKSGTAVVRFG